MSKKKKKKNHDRLGYIIAKPLHINKLQEVAIYLYKNSKLIQKFKQEYELAFHIIDILVQR